MTRVCSPATCTKALRISSKSQLVHGFAFVAVAAGSHEAIVGLGGGSVHGFGCSAGVADATGVCMSVREPTLKTRRECDTSYYSVL